LLSEDQPTFANPSLFQVQVPFFLCFLDGCLSRWCVRGAGCSPRGLLHLGASRFGVFFCFFTLRGWNPTQTFPPQPLTLRECRSEMAGGAFFFFLRWLWSLPQPFFVLFPLFFPFCLFNLPSYFLHPSLVLYRAAVLSAGRRAAPFFAPSPQALFAGVRKNVPPILSSAPGLSGAPAGVDFIEGGFCSFLFTHERAPTTTQPSLTSQAIRPYGVVLPMTLPRNLCPSLFFLAHIALWPSVLVFPFFLQLFFSITFSRCHLPDGPTPPPQLPQPHPTPPTSPRSKPPPPPPKTCQPATCFLTCAGESAPAITFWPALFAGALVFFLS